MTSPPGSSPVSTGLRKALLALLMVPLFVAPVREPTHAIVEPPPPPAFPFAFERTPADLPRPSALLFPLDGQGTAFALTSPQQGVLFDIDGNGEKEEVAWTRAGTNVAFLAVDLNGDGRINSGKELFGSATLAGTRNGCNALLQMFRQSGAPPSGSVHDGHDLYDRLLLWVDRNHDGHSDPTEVTKARESFTAIGLGYLGVAWADAHGNRVRYQGWMHARTGGPDQREAMDARDEAERRRRYFEVELQTVTSRHQ
jgi:hypothetical protein